MPHSIDLSLCWAIMTTLVLPTVATGQDAGTLLTGDSAVVKVMREHVPRYVTVVVSVDDNLSTHVSEEALTTSIEVELRRLGIPMLRQPYHVLFCEIGGFELDEIRDAVVWVATCNASAAFSFGDHSYSLEYWTSGKRLAVAPGRFGIQPAVAEAFRVRVQEWANLYLRAHSHAR